MGLSSSPSLVTDPRLDPLDALALSSKTRWPSSHPCTIVRLSICLRERAGSRATDEVIEGFFLAVLTAFGPLAIWALGAFFMSVSAAVESLPASSACNSW